MKTISENIKPILALIVVIMTYAIFLVILFRFNTDANAVSQVIIAVVGGFGVATGYYFASSSGSTKKDETIAKLSNTGSPTVGTSENTTVINQKQNGTDQATTE